MVVSINLDNFYKRQKQIALQLKNDLLRYPIDLRDKQWERQRDWVKQALRESKHYGV